MARRKQVLTTRDERITVKKAYEYLATMQKNRPIKQSKIGLMKRRIELGTWPQDGNAIKFDWDGHLIDGQHRLWAVIEADKPATFLIMEGFDPGIMEDLDQGTQRTLSDVLHLRGEKYIFPLAGSLRLLWSFVTIGVPTTSLSTAQRPLMRDYLKLLDDHPRLREGQSLGGLTARDVGGGSSVWAFIVYVLREISATDTEAFIQSVRTGENLPARHPVLALRKRLFASNNSLRPLRQHAVAALVFKAWNDYRDGASRSVLQWRAGGADPEPFPIPV